MGGGGGGVFWRMLIATNGLEEVSLHNPVILPLETMLVQPDLLLISIFGDAHCTTHICKQTNVQTDTQYKTLQMLGVCIDQTIGLMFAMHKLGDKLYCESWDEPYYKLRDDSCEKPQLEPFYEIFRLTS
jgi:hypothetical protein